MKTTNKRILLLSLVIVVVLVALPAAAADTYIFPGDQVENGYLTVVETDCNIVSFQLTHPNGSIDQKIGEQVTFPLGEAGIYSVNNSGAKTVYSISVLPNEEGKEWIIVNQEDIEVSSVYNYYGCICDWVEYPAWIADPADASPARMTIQLDGPYTVHAVKMDAKMICQQGSMTCTTVTTPADNVVFATNPETGPFLTFGSFREIIPTTPTTTDELSVEFRQFDGYGDPTSAGIMYPAISGVQVLVET